MNRLLLILLALAGSLCAQSAAPEARQAENRAAAYYNFAMGHMYAELAANENFRGEYVAQAIAHYKAALQADPGAGAASEELTDLYIQSGKLAEAVTEAEELLKRNPENVEARRMLGRIYSSLIQDRQHNRINQERLRQAIEQYAKVTEKEPKDVESWVRLGRLYKFANEIPNSENAYKKALETDPENEYALSGLLAVYSDAGDAQSATAMAKRLAEQNPNPRTLQTLARAYEEMQDYKSAAETWRRVLEANPQDSEIKRNLTEDEILSGNLDAAIALLNELRTADPKDYYPPLRLAQIYRQKRDLAKARQEMDKALALEPASLDVRFADAGLLEAEGKYPDAIARLKQILSATAKRSYSPAERANRVRLLSGLGALYQKSEQHLLAVEAFREIATVDPDNTGAALSEIIEAYRQAKDFASAEKEAAAAAQKYPDDRALKGARAMLLADLGRTEEGAALAKQLLNGNADRETYLLLAQIYDKGKKAAEADRALDAANKLSDTPEKKSAIHFMRGAIYEKADKLELAEKEFRQVLEIDPQNAGALNYVGYMLADRNLRLAEAEKMIRQALEIDPHNGAYLDSLGWALFRLGKLDDAELYLSQALQWSSRDATVHDHLADVYAAKGRVKEAIAQWEISLREWNASSRADADPEEIAKIQKKLESARVRLAQETGTGAPRR